MLRTNIIITTIIIILLAVLLFFNGEDFKRIKEKELNCHNCNVIIVGFDALQANRITHLGYDRDTTPTLDRLARSGVSFSNHYSVASWTVPSFMSYFTSLYPSEHGVVNKFSIFTKDIQEISNLKKLSPTVLTLANAFKNAGYSTGGFTGDAGVNSIFGYNSGFDVYTDEQAFGSMSRSATHALKWLDENRGKKFFMFFHGYDAHGQFSELPENYISRYADKNNLSHLNITPQKQKDLREKGLTSGELSLTQEEVSAWNAWYDGKIHDADDRLGAFLEELKKRGLLDNTLVVVISDHGTEVYEHKRFDHGYSLYNELIRVPLIITWPGKEIGKVIATQVRSIDLLPTLFEIIGLEKDGVWERQIRGESLIPVISKKDKKNRIVFSETDYRNYTHKRSFIDINGWKLIMTMENGDKELYNITKDPRERANLVQKNPERVREMTESLYALMERTGQNPNGPWTIGCLPVYSDQCLEQ